MSGIEWFIELQREAQEYLRPKPYLDESRPLTGAPADYVNAGDEPRYRCATLEYKPEQCFRPISQQGIDIDQFRKDCEEIGYD